MAQKAPPTNESHTQLRDELMQLERAYWQAIVDHDVEKALSLTDFPCVVVGSQGAATVDREQFQKMMQGTSDRLERFELKDDAEIRMISDDVAALAYGVHEEFTVDGKPVSMDASDASVWIRRNGRWACAVHTETLRGDPFGRDRQASTGSLRPKANPAPSSLL